MNILLTLAVLLLLSYVDTKTVPSNRDTVLNLDLTNLRDDTTAPEIVIVVYPSVNSNGAELSTKLSLNIFPGRPISNSPDLQRRGDEGNVEKRFVVDDFILDFDYDLQVKASAIAEMLNQYFKNMTAG